LGVFYIAEKGKNEYLTNEQIRFSEVRVISDDGSMLGIMSSNDALKIAEQKGLDLVLISPGAPMPVCKIIDYGKFLFEKSKKEKEMKRNQRVVELKEIRMTPKIEEHDFAFKTKNAMKFLQEGNKVKASIRFRGREMAHLSLGEKVLVEFIEALKEYGTTDGKPKMEGRNMSSIISPIENK
jgi:translation initiation factor IF-3